MTREKIEYWHHHLESLMEELTETPPTNMPQKYAIIETLGHLRDQLRQLHGNWPAFKESQKP